MDMDKLNKTIEGIVKITKYLMITLLIVMVISMACQIVARYLFRIGITWTEELTRFTNVWLVFLGSSLLVFKDEHIKVTILDSILKGRGLKILGYIRKIIFLLYSLMIVIVGSNSLKIVAYQTSPNMLLSMKYIYVAIPIGAGLTIVYLVHNFLVRRKVETNG